MLDWKPFFLGMFFISRLFALNTLEYAQKCEEKIGVPVPSFNCADPQATSLMATENGKRIPEREETQARCDNPSSSADHLSSFCQSGTRLLKYTDVIRRNGAEERISTVIMCRRSRGDSGNRFSDVAVIQLNETKNLSCWFSRQGANDSTKVPSPSAKNPNPDYWGATQPNMNCMSCHDGATFIYSPFMAQVRGTNGGYTKRPGDADYSKGGGNELPRSNLRVGPSCAFNMPGQPNPQPQLKVQLRAYENRFGASDRTKALPTACTECHYIGSGGMACGMARDSMTNSALQTQLSDWARRGINHRWMPPQEARPYWPRNFSTTEERQLSAAISGLQPGGALATLGEPQIDEVYKRQAKDYFAPALKALNYCCDTPNDREICGGRFVQTPADACFALNPPAGGPKRPAKNSGELKTHSMGEE